jgi:hypothetical protein
MGALLRDPDGLAIYFVNLRGMTRNGPAMKGDRKLGWFITTLAVKNLEQSVAFYQKLGFKRQPGSPDPSHVATLGKDDCSIGLYQGIIEPDKLQLTLARRCRSHQRGVCQQRGSLRTRSKHG